MTTLLVQAAVAGRKRAGAEEHEIRVSLPLGTTTLRTLIEAIVRSEVTSFEQRAEGARVVRLLTDRDIDEGLIAGTIRSGGATPAAPVDPGAAVRTALEAQVDGLYQTIVDEHPIDDLDTTLELRDGTRVMFLRLVPLAGG